jgi:hypothetical protein
MIRTSSGCLWTQINLISYEVTNSVNTWQINSTIFCDITLCSPLSVNRRFGGTYRLHLQVRKKKLSKKPAWKKPCSACHLLSRWFLAQFIFSILKMEAICSSDTSVGTQRTTRRYIPEDSTLHNHRCENLKSYIASQEGLWRIVYM